MNKKAGTHIDISGKKSQTKNFTGLDEWNKKACKRFRSYLFMLFLVHSFI